MTFVQRTIFGLVVSAWLTVAIWAPAAGAQERVEAIDTGPGMPDFMIADQGSKAISAVLPPGTFQIGNLADGSCLTLSGSVLVETLCSALTNNQFWFYTYVGRSGGTNYYNLVNYSTGTCLDVVNGSYDNGARLTSSSCCPQCTSQWWRQQNPGPWPGSYQIRNLPSGKCVDMPLVPGTYNAWNGDPIGQWACGSYREGRGANQYWGFRSF